MTEAQTDKIRTKCSDCGAEYVVFSSLAGKQVRCVKCQATFTVPPPPTPPGQSAPVPSAPAGPAAKNSTDRHLKWLADNMTEIVCPHCRLAYSVSKAFIGQYMACPRCRRKYIISPQGHAVDHQTPIEHFLEDKTAVRAVAAASIVLVLIVLMAVFVGSSRKAQLLGTMRGTYPVPKYEVSRIKAPKVHYTHKVSDGSQKCPTVAFVHVAHLQTGLEFNRMLCRVDGVWGPTYYQRLLDEAARRYLDDMETGRQHYGSGFDDMVSQMFSQEASNYGEMYNRIPQVINEEEMLKKASIPALEMLTHGNDWTDYFYSYDEDEDEDFEYPSYRQPYYRAHAVIYPDQAYDLFHKGLISQMP